MALTQISTAGVKDDAVTSGKIPANAVGSSELADNAVDTAAIANSAVTYAKIENFGQNQVLGRVASGNGAATNLTAANVRTLINVEDGATADQTASEIKTLLQSDKLTNSEIADQTVTLDKLPHGTSSNDGKFLRANNGADPTFETVSIPAGTTINNNADNRVITGSGTANTLNGESTFTYTGSRLGVNISGGTITDVPATSHDTVLIGNSSMTTGGICLEGNGAASGNLGYQMYKGGSFPCARLLFEGSSNELQLHSTSTAAGSAPAAETRKMRLLPGGDVVIDDGDLVLASGHGIDFSATTNYGTSTPAELLDDYEEGQFLPAFSTTNGQILPFTQRGEYCKIGRVVHCMWSISSNGTSGTTNGTVTITGFPFTGEVPSANGPRGGGGVIYGGYGSPSTLSRSFIQGTTLYILLNDGSYLDYSDATNTGGNGFQMSGMITYLTTQI
jgi:hypothetical protein